MAFSDTLVIVAPVLLADRIWIWAVNVWPGMVEDVLASNATVPARKPSAPVDVII